MIISMASYTVKQTHTAIAINTCNSQKGCSTVDEYCEYNAMLCQNLASISSENKMAILSAYLAKCTSVRDFSMRASITNIPHLRDFQSMPGS